MSLAKYLIVLSLRITTSSSLSSCGDALFFSSTNPPSRPSLHDVLYSSPLVFALLIKSALLLHLANRSRHFCFCSSVSSQLFSLLRFFLAWFLSLDNAPIVCSSVLSLLSILPFCFTGFSSNLL